MLDHHIIQYWIGMLNFASLFNQFRSQATSSFGDLLEQPGVRMGRLLDEESFVNEYKSGGSPKVNDFMKYERYEELIEYITVVGPADDKKRSYKYPLAACDMLCIDNSTALDYLFPDRPLTISQTIIEEVEEEVEEKIEEEPQVVAEKHEEPAKTEEAQVESSGKEIEEKTSEIEQEVPQNTEPPKQLENQTKPQPQQAPIKYRKVKVTRKNEKIVQRELPALIDKLMGYFNGEINYTLAGYVCRVLSYISNKKPLQFLAYFLQSKFTGPILNHAESRSVGELINKVLVHESQGCIQERKAFFSAVLSRLSLNSEVYIMSNLSAYVVEAIEKAAANLKSGSRISEFADLFFSLQVVTQVIKNVMSEEENVSVYSAPVLLAFLTSVPFVLPEDEAVRADFQQLVKHFVERSCEKLNVRAQNHPKIGLGRIKIIEILRFLLKEDILSSRDIIAKSNIFFEVLLALFREYPLSNMLHNEIVKILDIALTENEKTALNVAILKDNLLLKFIKEEAQEDKRIRAGDSVYKSRKGFIAHLINIAARLRELSETNTSIKAAIEDPQHSEIYQSFFEKEIFNSKKSLAGFSVKRDAKQHEIKFQKEDIIAAYATFLRKCPPPVFQEPEPTADSHPDLVEELQKQIQQSLNVKHKQTEKHVEVPKSEEKSETEESTQRESKFQESLLSYDIEELGLDW